MTATVRNVAVTNFSAGPMQMEGVLDVVRSGAILDSVTPSMGILFGSHASKTATAFGMYHVAAMLDIQAVARMQRCFVNVASLAVTSKAELFVNLQPRFIIIIFFLNVPFLREKSPSRINSFFAPMQTDQC